jgi:hypothetical protein
VIGDEPANTIKDRRRRRLLCRGAKESYHRAEAACGWSLPACLTVKPVGEPDALIGHVRFDERGWKRSVAEWPKLPRPSSTLPFETCRRTLKRSAYG